MRAGWPSRLCWGSERQVMTAWSMPALKAGWEGRGTVRVLAVLFPAV
jgi:hypothetical protein